MLSKLDHALALARKGFRVFPLNENAKTPAIDKWPEKATTNEKQIKAWWSETPFNIGLATGKGVVVLDYDMKEGQHGQRALETHDLLGLPLDGPMVTTPSGGVHLYFKTTEAIHNSVSKIAKNVDVRGENGYVVAPGSTIGGKPYILSDADSVDLPAWIAEQAKTKSTNVKDSKTPLGEVDRPEQIEAALLWLMKEAPAAAQGDAGDATTFKVACRVKDYGLSKQTCLELLLDNWNEGNSPPWSGEDLEQKVANAYAYGSLPPGIDDPKGEFGGADVSRLDTGIETDATPKLPKLFWVDFNKAADDAIAVLNRPLIEDLLDCGGLSALYGRPGSKKTFAALDWAFHVATGKPWNGHATTQGLVIYVAAEGGYAIYKRLRALRQHHGVSGQIPFAIVPCPVNLLDAARGGDTQELIKLIRQAEEHYGMKAKLVVIDTLSRALAGGDENSSTDMGTFVKHLDKIRTSVGAHLMVVAHSGKDQAKGLRGWSGILAALDTEIEIHEGQIKVTKQRDMDAIEPVRFAVTVVDMGMNAAGTKHVTSLVLDYSKEAVAKEEMDSLTEQEQAILEVIEERERAGETRQKTTAANGAILQFGLSKGLTTLPSDKSNLSRGLSKLSDAGLIQKNEFGQWVTK